MLIGVAMTTGVTGHVLMNDNADREPNYWLWQVNPEMQDDLEVLADISVTTDTRDVSN